MLQSPYSSILPLKNCQICSIAPIFFNFNRGIGQNLNLQRFLIGSATEWAP
ncbi:MULTISPECIES: hypothetical protein [Leptolyngbya]|uniref:hypothetical protein n=1 Tax=Leptolyngbya TaxID=47251 RepID=UPI0003A069C1|nr:MULTISPECIES: hypothetical protein [Leptolyngbya]MBD2402311.1 hypothetical protein [Leptolyngbya sp. FACHB-239]MBD2408803.1 hypothetical protein [Leptolyngbya sp. FACHB-402]